MRELTVETAARGVATTRFERPGWSAADSELLAAYPTLRQAAAMLAVDPSTLSRRADLQAVRSGREKRLSPREVMRLGAVYKHRTPYELAGSLVALALETAPNLVDRVEAEIERTFDEPAPSEALDPVTFLAQAKKFLPNDLYRQVERAYQESADESVALAGAIRNSK